MSVRVGPAAPGGPSSTAAHFDGVGSHLVVEDHPVLRLGTGELTVTAWVYTDGKSGDVVGDIVSKFDGEARTGFGLSVVTNGGVTCTTQANYRHIHWGVDCGQIEAGWADCGRPGNAVNVTALQASEGELYAATFEAGVEETGHLWQYLGAQQWQDLGATPDRSNCVSSLTWFGGALFCCTGRYYPVGSALGEARNARPGGRVYRVEGDGRWTDCGHPGAEDATPEYRPVGGYETGKADDAMSLTVHNGDLYVTSNHRRGAFRYEGGHTWRYVGPNERLLSFVVYQQSLYALVNGGSVCRYEGGTDWAFCGCPAGSTQTYSAAIHGGNLYVGTWPEGEVHRYEGGQEWTNVGRAGYEREIMAMALYNQKVYLGGLPMANVYRMDGGRFALVGTLDCTPMVYLRRVWSMAVWKGRLYAGTLPSGRVWSLGAGAAATDDRALPPGWHYLSAVRCQDRLKLYVDGRLASTCTAFVPADYDLTCSQPLLIGLGAHTHFCGQMSDVRLYNRALGENEIAQLSGL